jgi:DNA polymerase-3 subunit delta'
VREWIERHRPGLEEDEANALARVAGGRLDRARRLLDPASRERRAALIAAARSVYGNGDFDPGAGADVILGAATARGAEAKEREEALIEGLDLPAREGEQRVRRAQRGAEREELLASLDELAAWYRDLLAVGAGAERVVLHADRLADLRADANARVDVGSERAVELVRDAWRVAEEFNVNAPLWLEALFVRLRRSFA